MMHIVHVIMLTKRKFTPSVDTRSHQNSFKRRWHHRELPYVTFSRLFWNARERLKTSANDIILGYLMLVAEVEFKNWWDFRCYQSTFAVTLSEPHEGSKSSEWIELRPLSPIDRSFATPIFCLEFKSWPRRYYWCRASTPSSFEVFAGRFADQNGHLVGYGFHNETHIKSIRLSVAAFQNRRMQCGELKCRHNGSVLSGRRCIMEGYGPIACSSLSTVANV